MEKKTHELLIETHGGRESLQKNVKDCVTRAIAIAFDKDYKDVYNKLYERAKHYAKYGKSDVAAYLRRKPRKQSPRNGCFSVIYEYWIKKFGFIKIPVQKKGIKWNFDEEFIRRIPNGTYIFRIQKPNKKAGHLVTVKANKVYDSWNCLDYGYKVVNMYCTKDDFESREYQIKKLDFKKYL